MLGCFGGENARAFARNFVDTDCHNHAQSSLMGREAATVRIELLVVDSDDAVADKLARRIVRDMSDTAGVAGASLISRPGAGNERGMISDIGAAVVDLATAGAVQGLVGLVKSLLRPGGDREIVLKLPDGTEFALKGGGVSEAQFAKTTDSLLALLARDDSHETA
jgi:hypothetical protein